MMMKHITDKHYLVCCLHNSTMCLKWRCMCKVSKTNKLHFNFTRRNEWYATQNLCPHRMQMALSRGMIGSQDGEPKVACPFHKKTFSLVDGQCMNGDECGSIKTYPVKVEGNMVYIGVPETDENHTKLLTYKNRPGGGNLAGLRS